MSDSHKHDTKDIPGRALAATFQSREEAKRAIGALHKAHFKKTWLGTTSVAVTANGEETLTAEGGSGFFSQDAGSLVDALVKQDVDGETARSIESGAIPGCAIVTVKPPDDDKHDPSEAAQILSRFGGQVAGRTMAGVGAGTGSSSYASGIDDGFDDALVYEEQTFYRR